ncbi:MAG TPA: GNAT family N-acetyltransferase, partial [Ktedonobacterales bacterium]
DWWINRMMPGGHVLGIYLKATGEAVGQANFLEENPEDGMPWLGLLMIAAPHQRQGVGREAFGALATYFRTTYGWPALRLGVLVPNTTGLAFWRALGFEQVEEKGEDARRVFVLERVL